MGVGDLKVRVSGEGDFEVSADNAWHVDIQQGDHTWVVVSICDGGLTVMVDAEQIWPSADAEGSAEESSVGGESVG